ncbi:DUF4124 domain-containing protein [Pseudomonas sp. BLCC-B13]|uniref:DUF4124 domain-containing protein n=1 Tax=Pseudomonas sp. BLCC-B13 TaxID=3025314 RepID=UPI00234F2C41|nr:DUF4124 domain-containing protein [Pseudomonas sp. BLCC-B13]MDC7826258.1 DUF4124 domain-containing protein [Pseudomonas sp. BLCC-B13]
MQHIKFLLFLFAILAQSANADIYSCLDSDGKKSFKDRPCEEQTISVQKNTMNESPSASAGSADGVLSENDLIGRWTDYIDDDLRQFRSVWNFSYGSLNTQKANGVRHSHKYKLDGNKLIIFLNQSDAKLEGVDKYEIEIKAWDGKKITFGEGAPVGQMYLYKL